MTVYLTLDDLLDTATFAIGPGFEVADYGLLTSALARPQASAFGVDAYSTLHEKAAALLHSLVCNHGLVDGNKRLGWVATVLFYALNDVRLAAPSAIDGEAFILTIADGSLVEVREIAKTLRAWTGPLNL